MKKIFLTIILMLVSFFFCTISVSAQTEIAGDLVKEETLEAKVEKVLEEKQIKPIGSEKFQLYQKLELLVTKGSLKDTEIFIESGNIPFSNLPKYKTGDRVIVSYSKDLEGNDTFYITDYIRRSSLLWLFIIFASITIIIGKLRGISSLLGMALSFAIIFIFILPKILSGSDPISTAIIGSIFIIPVTFFLSHGFSKKTSVAIAGTLIALIITGILAGVFVDISKLSGFASEEAGFLQAEKGELINIKGLLLAGIIIGVLGVLDDITISQSAIVFQLKETNPKIKFEELYKRAMNVGQDHISSMVNTLILVYTGASLPLLLLFINNPHPFSEVINYEIVADEVIRTLVGSIGLVLTVPITTLLASIAVNKKI